MQNKPTIDMSCCGIFVRNEKKVQLNWLETHPAGGNVVGGKKFKTFGKAARVAWNMGFRMFETDDRNIRPLTVHVVQIANR